MFREAADEKTLEWRNPNVTVRFFAPGGKLTDSAKPIAVMIGPCLDPTPPLVFRGMIRGVRLGDAEASVFSEALRRGGKCTRNPPEKNRFLVGGHFESGTCELGHEWVMDWTSENGAIYILGMRDKRYKYVPLGFPEPLTLPPLPRISH
jgi:hypothetical protein